MHILRQLPFRDHPYTVDVAGENVLVRAYQILVWVSLSAQPKLPKGLPRFPAILDSGHNHNFSLQEHQLENWAGLRRDAFAQAGIILVNREEVPLVAGNLWIHRNRPGTSELLPRPYQLEVPAGIALYPAEASRPPRLPLLGLRPIVASQLRLMIDGERQAVSLRSHR